MHLFLLGVSHRTAPVEVRERLDFAARGLDDALAALAARPGASESVVLSTCNRAELYVACDDTFAARAELRRLPLRLPRRSTPARSIRTCTRRWTARRRDTCSASRRASTRSSSASRRSSGR